MLSSLKVTRFANVYAHHPLHESGKIGVIVLQKVQNSIVTYGTILKYRIKCSNDLIIATPKTSQNDPIVYTVIYTYLAVEQNTA